MPTRRSRAARALVTIVAGALVCLGLAAPATAAAGPAVGASVSGPTTINPQQSTTLRATYSKSGRPVASATLKLQKLSGGAYRTVGTFAIRNGSGSTTLAPNTTARYRVANHDGSAVSASVKVTVLQTYVHAALSGPSSIASGQSSTMSVMYVKKGALVPAATLTLQYRSGAAWRSAGQVTVTGGRGSVVLRPSVTRTYRAVNFNGTLVSPAVTVAVVRGPSSFTITGSGYGHGVGMPQYGAYAMALAGRSAVQILTYYYTGTTVDSRDTRKYAIAVQVFGPDPAGRSSYGERKASTTFSLDAGAWTVTDRANGVRTISGTGKVTLAVTAGQVEATAGSAVLKAKRLDLDWGPGSVAKVSGAQGSYKHGRLTATAIGSYLNVTNELSLNTDYLYGIAEMPSSWGSSDTSALEAQAIAARSYALANTGNRRASCDCHVVDDVRDQNFTGWKKENEGTGGYYGKIWKRAVDATVTSSKVAQVLTDDGEPIVTHYYAASGGGTANSEDVWVSRIDYERSVPDPWSLKAPGNPYVNWTNTITQSKARQVFGLPEVLAISVTATWPGGQVRTVTATAPDGRKASITGKASAVRAKLGATSTWIHSIR